MHIASRNNPNLITAQSEGNVKLPPLVCLSDHGISFLGLRVFDIFKNEMWNIFEYFFTLSIIDMMFVPTFINIVQIPVKFEGNCYCWFGHYVHNSTVQSECQGVVGCEKIGVWEQKNILRYCHWRE